MKVIVFKFNHLGDNIVFVPVIQALRALHPDWTITLLTTPRETPLYGGARAPSAIMTAEKDAFDKSYRRPWRLAAWIARIRAIRPDACLLGFDQGTVAHLVARESGAPIRVGGNLQHVRIGRSLTHEVPIPERMRPADWNWELLRSFLKATGDAAAESLPPYPPPPDFSHLLSQGVDGSVQPWVSGRPRIVIHAGSSRLLNRWPTERFAAVAARLARDHEVAWVDNPETRAAELPPNVRRFEPSSLAAMASLFASSDFFIGNNSGPMHLANALGCTGLAVVGSTAYGWDPYWHRDRWKSLRHPTLPCAPCESAHKTLRGCALVSDPMACLRFWSAAAVEAACRESLAARIAS
jgi:ADP-heptose:LPS heptosyltransferase